MAKENDEHFVIFNWIHSIVFLWLNWTTELFCISYIWWWAVDTIAVWHALPITLKNQQQNAPPSQIHVIFILVYAPVFYVSCFLRSHWLHPFYSIWLHSTDIYSIQIEHRKKVDYVRCLLRKLFSVDTIPVGVSCIFYHLFLYSSFGLRHSFRWARYRNNGSGIDNIVRRCLSTPAIRTHSKQSFRICTSDTGAFWQAFDGMLVHTLYRVHYVIFVFSGFSSTQIHACSCAHSIY